MRITITIDWDLPRLYRFRLLRYRWLRSMLKRSFLALSLAGASIKRLQILKTRKGFHLWLELETELPEITLRALLQDDPIRIARDLIRQEQGLRTQRLRHIKKRGKKIYQELPDKKAMKIALEVAKEVFS